MLDDILAGALAAILAPLLGPDDFERDGLPRSSHWLRKRHRWDVALRQRPDVETSTLPRRWRRAVLSVHSDGTIDYRLRRRLHRRSAPAITVRRVDVRLPAGRETSKHRQIFPTHIGSASAEIAIWATDVRLLKKELDRPRS